MTRTGLLFFLFVFFIGIIFSVPLFAFADTAGDIQSKIDTNKSQVAALETDIAAFQKQLDALGATKNTLQSTISSLTISQKQLASQIQVTQSKISSANLQIQQLTFSIGDKEVAIGTNQAAIAKALRSVAQDEQTPLIVGLISAHSLNDAWQTTDEALQFNRALSDDVKNLRSARTVLATNRDKVTVAKTELVSLQNEFTTQKRSVDAGKIAQQQLLSQTKNQETNYQQLIAQKKASEKAFEQEIVNLQGQLNLVVHPNLLPKVGSGVLSWPFSNTFMSNCAKRKSVFGNPFCITQYFGTTSFATANPQLYNGKGHNAIDIGVPIGTPVYTALGGVVLGTGNTDLVKGCYSFGKWIMIVHNNGISTLYSHLSTIDVEKGQTVSTGQVLGLSGMTGFATGPHLHFAVYATEGTEIMTLKQFRGATTACANATMPVATLTAYLNPLSYL